MPVPYGHGPWAVSGILSLQQMTIPVMEHPRLWLAGEEAFVFVTGGKLALPYSGPSLHRFKPTLGSFGSVPPLWGASGKSTPLGRGFF